MKTIKTIIEVSKFLFLVVIVLFQKGNIICAQTCSPCNQEKRNVFYANIDVSAAKVALFTADNALSLARITLTAATLKSETLQEFANECEKRNEELKNVVRATGAAKTLAEIAFKNGRITAAALAIAVDAATVALATYGAAVIAWSAAKLEAMLAKQQVDKAQKLFDYALRKWADASKWQREAEKYLKEKEKELENCMSRVPGQCKKCENGNIVSDNNQNPGMCKKCEDGTVVNDDSKDPGMCKKCENGIVVNDDSEIPGPCQKCENGVAVIKCTSGQKCCNGTCVNIEYEYLVTVTTVTCDGSSTTSYMSSSCSSGTTGQFEYSFGVCVGGSIVTISCSGPYPVPCEE